MNFNKNMNPFIDAIESLLTKSLLLIFTPEFIFLRDSNLKGPRSDVHHEILTRNIQGCTFSPPLSKLSKVCVEIFDTIPLLKMMKLARKNLNKTNSLVLDFKSSTFTYTAINSESRLDLRGDIQLHGPDSVDYEKYVQVCRSSASFADNFPTRSNLLELSHTDLKRINSNIRKKDEGSYIDLDFYESHLSVRDGQDLGQDMKASTLQLAKDRLKNYEACTVLKELKRDNFIRSQLPIKVLQTLCKLMKKDSSNLLLYVTEMVTNATGSLNVDFTVERDGMRSFGKVTLQFKGVNAEDPGPRDDYEQMEESNSMANSLRKAIQNITPGTNNRSNSGPNSQNHNFTLPGRISNISHQHIPSNRSSEQNIFFPPFPEDSRPSSSRISFGPPGDFKMDGNSFIDPEPQPPNVYEAGAGQSPFTAMKAKFLQLVEVDERTGKYVMHTSALPQTIVDEGTNRLGIGHQGADSMSWQQAPLGQADASKTNNALGLRKVPKTAINRIEPKQGVDLQDECFHMAFELVTLLQKEVQQSREQAGNAPIPSLGANMRKSDWII